MISAAAAALIGAGLSAAGGVASNVLQSNTSKKAFQYNKELLGLQNQFSLDMWNRANDYNTPSSQVQRLQDAGLNPLYYGLDGSSANAFESASASPYVSPTFTNPFAGMEHLSALLADTKVKQAQADNLVADTAKKNNENVTETQRRANMQADIDKINAEIEEILSRTDLNAEQREVLSKTKEWIDRKEQANLDYTESMTRLNESQINRIDQLLEGEKVMQAKSIQEFEYRWKAMLASASKDSALASLTEKDIENYALTHMDSGFMGTGASLKNLGLLGSEAVNKTKSAIKRALGKE